MEKPIENKPVLRNINNQYNNYAFNLRNSFVGLNLISAYHSIMNLPYYNALVHDPHWQQLTMAFFIIKGSIRFKIGKNEVVLRENQIMFGTTGQDVLLLDDGNKAEFISFYFQIFNYSLPLFTPYTLPSATKELETTLRIIECLRMQSTLGVGSANAIFMDLLFSWLREIRVVDIGKIPHGDLMLDAELYINEHIESRLTVAELAQKYNFSEKHFRELFARVVGISPKQYIERVKIERAYTLLKNTSLSVAEIADKLQFSNGQHLSSAFRKLYQMTPTECRRSTT